MGRVVEMPVWALILLVAFAAVTFASHFLFPSVRWFFRKRMERAVARLNTRLERPIQPFKLARRFDMIQRLIYDPEVSLAIGEYARKNGVPENVAFEQARRYAREIVPSFSATAYFTIAIRLAKYLTLALYRVRLNRFHDQRIGDIDADATVIFVMNHRSNMDYVLVTYLIADRSALSYAVGEWAQVWPLSRLIKAMGAYFIRRRSRNALYRRVLARYVQLATRGGVTQAMFPEGGLSLDGALAPPKLGLLSYLTDGVDLAARDVVFVPVALNYDRVLEDRILLAAGASGTRRFKARISVVALKALKQLWLRMTGRFHRFGYAAVSFGRPISLRAAPQYAADADALAAEIMKRISDVVPVLPVPLVSYLLLKNGPLDRAGVERAFSAATQKLDPRIVHMPRNNRDYAVEFGLRALSKRKLIVERDGVFSVVPSEVETVRFYANSIRHLLP